MVSASTATCQRRAESVALEAHGDRVTASFPPIAEYRNGLILLVIEANSVIGKVTC